MHSIGRGRALQILLAAKNRPGTQQASAHCNFTTLTNTRIGVLQEHPPVISDPSTDIISLAGVENDLSIHASHNTSEIGVSQRADPSSNTSRIGVLQEYTPVISDPFTDIISGLGVENDLAIHASHTASQIGVSKRVDPLTHNISHTDTHSLTLTRVHPGGGIYAPETIASRVRRLSPTAPPATNTQITKSHIHAISKSSGMYSQAAFGGYNGPTKINISDSLIAPTHFHGLSSESPEDFLEHFQRYSDFKQLPKPQAAQLFGMLLRGSAGRWFVVLGDGIKTDYDLLIEAFKRSYFKQEETNWLLAKSLWSETQGTNETVLDFVSRIKRLAHQLKATDEQINHAVVAGLQPHLRLAVLQTGQVSLEQTIRFARIAESNGPPQHDSSATNSLLETIRQQNEIAKEQSRQISNLTSKLADLANNTQVSAGVESYERNNAREDGRTRAWSPRRPELKITPQRVQRENYVRREAGERPRPLFQRGTERSRNPCGNCGRMHQIGECKAKGVTCYNCQKLNHLARFCRSARQNSSQ